MVEGGKVERERERERDGRDNLFVVCTLFAFSLCTRLNPLLLYDTLLLLKFVGESALHHFWERSYFMSFIMVFSGKRGRRSRKAAPTNSKSSTTSNEADDCIQPISPLQSPDHSPGLIIESDCDSPLPPPSSCPSDSPTQTTINSTTFIADSLHITTSPPTSEGIPGKGDNEAEDSCHTVTKTTSDIEKHDLDYEENRIDTEITFSNSPTKETNLLNHTNHNPANAVKSTCL